ncbi:MAG TPA: phosphoglyceromutase [Microthrixaceae bacterium]|jgi:2,3-bisphosphoglycerate-dependent phosphoglycerate mutase|nr:phosphoglyceromutase [Actinomycetota bacterium]HMS13711.1 phosphoglyceromutase [Microthrixaceae bacterium]HMT23530.1 phosphoglyceromutase [Microthrixaceae bacterium]HMT59553.1 phosphoglyceromutase [Microthrixaceae bacterium]
MSDLILLRHGRSEWNERNLFTGWYDCDLIDQGIAEASAAGTTMLDAGVHPTVVHTSLQKRAIRTAQLALDTMDLMWLPVRRHWRLNERHYGDLTGRNKADTAARFGEDQVKVWRRSYDVPPPPIAEDNDHNPNGDAQYASLPTDLVPRSECLQDVVERMLPYWYDAIVPDLAAGNTVLVVAHGNSLRALVKHLDDISDDEITELNIPTGIPLRYELGPDFRPVEAKPTAARYLGDADAAAAAAAAVAAQASGN